MLQEHWLWPFELDQLGSIDPDFAYTAVCDNRLSPSSTLTRGCGGCSILWHKSISAVPLSNLESDRICGIQLPIEGSQLLTIVGVYMPSSEYPQEIYNNAVNQAISSAPPSSPLLLVGDLNCHIWKLGGPRSLSDPNQRGVLVEHNSLCIPSLSTLATGPVQTFHSNRTATTVDYAISNLSLSTVLVSSRVEEDHPLNTSDHLPIVSKLNLSLLTSPSIMPLAQTGTQPEDNDVYLATPRWLTVQLLLSLIRTIAPFKRFKLTSLESRASCSILHCMG